MPHGSKRSVLATLRDRSFGLLPPSRGRGRTGQHRQAPEHGMAGQPGLVIYDEDEGLSGRIEAELCAFNAQTTGHHDLQPLRIAIRDGGDLLAGLSGSTWGGCGFIELIWVRADHRRRGMGTRLLEAGEGEIRRRRCDQVALSTYSFQAPGFYVGAGYVECGRRSSVPHGYDQILFTKRL